MICIFYPNTFFFLSDFVGFPEENSRMNEHLFMALVNCLKITSKPLLVKSLSILSFCSEISNLKAKMSIVFETQISISVTSKKKKKTPAQTSCVLLDAPGHSRSRLCVARSFTINFVKNCWRFWPQKDLYRLNKVNLYHKSISFW